MADLRRIGPALLAGLLVAFSILTYVNTRDPTILVVALLGAGVILAITLVVRRLGAGGAHLHCPACGREAAMDAKRCGQCGAALVRA
jgi:hypothetical protein